MAEMKRIALFFACIMSLAMISLMPIAGQNVSVATLSVGGASGQFASIQDAIDAAAEGDTVYVNIGTFHEDIYIGKKLNLIGNDTAATIIDGTGSSSVITVASDWVRISGLTVTGSGTSSNDAGILLSGANNCTVQNVTVTGNRYGIFSTASYGNSIFNNNFIDNTHQAYDNSANTWCLDLPAGGNFWDDQELTDEDGNGVTDSAYTIPGGTNRDSKAWTAEAGWLSYVPEDKFEVDAVSMMLIGMGVVFAILTILWISTEVTGILFQKYEAKKKASQGGAGETETVAAIAAAIDSGRN